MGSMDVGRSDVGSGEVGSKNGRPLVSLTMIVKNEEADLPACLESARTIADEIIVVDTGSTDRTVEIAREYGAQVHFFTWCDDFAAARNAALAHATGEWVLHLDADELAIETTPGAVRDELTHQPEGVLFMRVPVRSPFANGMGYDVYGARRLFRNRPEISWTRPIHETIRHTEHDSIELEASCAALVVDHKGYADPVLRKEQGKNARNMRLLKREMAERPDDPTVYYYLAVEHASLEQWPTALKLLQQGLKRFEGAVRPDFTGAMYGLAMRCAINMGRPREAIRLGQRAVKHYAFSEVCYLLGCAYRLVDDLPQAERYLELAIALRSRFAEFQMEAGTGSWKATIELGVVAWTRGDRPIAVERWRRAHSWMPDQALPNLWLGIGLLGTDKASEAVGYFRRAIEIASGMAEAHLRLSQALAQTGQRQAAYDHLEALTQRHPEVPQYWHWLGDLLYECAEYEACVQVLGRAIDRHREHSGIYLRLGSALRQLNRYQDALHAYALAAALEPESIAARAGLATVAHALEWGVTAPAPKQFVFDL